MCDGVNLRRSSHTKSDVDVSFLLGYQVSIVMVIDIVNGHRIPGHSRWLLSRLTASYDDDDDDDDRGGGEDPTLIRRNDLYRSRGLFESNRPNNCRVCTKKNGFK